MCLDIDKRYHANPKKAFIARTDIVCYKILRRKVNYSYNEFSRETSTFTTYSAPYRHFQYEMGKLYETKGMKVDKYLSVDAGLHSFKSLRSANRRNEEAIFGQVYPAIIPRGSRVFMGTGSELVSNRLIVYKDNSHLEAVWGKIKPRIPYFEGLR